MRVISAEPRGVNPDGTQVVDAFILADDVPSPLPTTVNGMALAPFSIMYIVNTGDVYIANESGEFVKQ